MTVNWSQWNVSYFLWGNLSVYIKVDKSIGNKAFFLIFITSLYHNMCSLYFEKSLSLCISVCLCAPLSVSLFVYVSLYLSVSNQIGNQGCGSVAESLASIYKAPGLILVLEQISLLTKQEKKANFILPGHGGLCL